MDSRWMVHLLVAIQCRAAHKMQPRARQPPIGRIDCSWDVKHQQPESSKVLLDKVHKCVPRRYACLVGWLLLCLCLALLLYYSPSLTTAAERADTHRKAWVSLSSNRERRRRKASPQGKRRRSACMLLGYTVIGICQRIGTPREGHHF
jgi:hypothetical protein